MTFLRKIHFPMVAAFMAAVLLAASFGASAQRVEGDRARAEGIYATEVTVNGQGETERNAAFARGLAQVLGKLSGDRGAASKPGVGNELRQAKVPPRGSRTSQPLPSADRATVNASGLSRDGRLTSTRAVPPRSSTDTQTPGTTAIRSLPAP